MMRTRIIFPVLCAVLLLVSSPIAGAADGPGGINPRLLEQSIGLFPDLKGPYELRFKDDIRVPELGFQMINYTLLAGGDEAGTVTRIMSIFNEGVTGNVDMLARFDEKGAIKDMVSLKPWSDEETDMTGIWPLLSYFKGRDVREQKEVLIKLINGLAMGYGVKDAKPSPKPPKDKVWDLRGKVLERGAKLPPLKTKDLHGKEFNTAKVKGKFMVVFTSPICKPCGEMMKSLSRAMELFDGGRKATVLYAVAADGPAARSYAERLGLKGVVVAEPDDHVANAFKAPFKPYALMFESGTLKYNLLWKEERQLFGAMFVFLNGRPPTPDEVGELERRLEAMGLKK